MLHPSIRVAYDVPDSWHCPAGAFRFPNISAASNWSGANWNHHESGLVLWSTARPENARGDEHGTLTKITPTTRGVRVGIRPKDREGAPDCGCGLLLCATRSFHGQIKRPRKPT